MIHTLVVDADTYLADLKKNFRRKLMTGGAVIRLKDGLTAAEQRAIFNRFRGEAQPNNIAAQVLVQLASLAEADAEVLAELSTITLQEVRAALGRR